MNVLIFSPIIGPFLNKYIYTILALDLKKRGETREEVATIPFLRFLVFT